MEVRKVRKVRKVARRPYRSARNGASLPGYKIKFRVRCVLSPTNVPLSPSLFSLFSPVSEMHSFVLRRATSLAAKPITSVSRRPRPSSNTVLISRFDVADLCALLRHRKARYTRENISTLSNCLSSIFLQRRRRCRLSSSRELLAPRSAVMSRRLAVF